MESLLFDALNRIVEPAVRSGCGSPGFLPSGLVVLETTGRVSGRARRVPLLATAFGEVVVVSTVRGSRSQWLANARGNPDVRYWLHGAPRHGRAYIINSRDEAPEIEQPVARKLARALGAAAKGGLSFAIIVPSSADQGADGTP